MQAQTQPVAELNINFTKKMKDGLAEVVRRIAKSSNEVIRAITTSTICKPLQEEDHYRQQVKVITKSVVSNYQHCLKVHGNYQLLENRTVLETAILFHTFRACLSTAEKFALNRFSQITKICKP